MPKQIDYDALARSFLDLWQDQASRLARDPEMRTMAEQWTAMFMPVAHGAASRTAPERPEDGFSPDYRAGGASRARGASGMGDAGGDDGNRSRQSGAAGSAAPAAVPDDRDAELERLAARVRELEERLAGVESRARERAAGSGTAAERKRRVDSRKRRS
ncbi:hypothetical protein [Nisaea sp.]|uniref:hypothetical protein n=1 Tax=Nisaea sp. TaxID=2024842 RepID=UPI003B5190AC